VVLVNKCVSGGDMLSLGTSLNRNQTLISRNDTFELGFFNPNRTNKWYIGIWYDKYKVIVWVGNREASLLNMPGILTLGNEGYLTLSDTNTNTIWLTNETQRAKASMALILYTNNFVMVGTQNPSLTVWESFENATYTLFPGMKFWKGMNLTSWKNSLDLVRGPFSLLMDPTLGRTQIMLLYNDSVPYFTISECDKVHFPNAGASTQRHPRDEELKQISPIRMYYGFIVLTMVLL
ncbi:hypothetical protein KI387_034087, partial [Taxus chinensis]